MIVETGEVDRPFDRACIVHARMISSEVKSPDGNTLHCVLRSRVQKLTIIFSDWLVQCNTEPWLLCLCVLTNELERSFAVVVHIHSGSD